MLIHDGGGTARPATTPTRAPTVSRAEREGPATSRATRSTTVTPPRAERGPAATPKLQAAARTTEFRVARAKDAAQTLDRLEQIPPRSGGADLRLEIASARREADKANRQAQRAITTESNLALRLLSPAHYERYEQDLATQTRELKSTAAKGPAAGAQSGAATAARPPDAKAIAADVERVYQDKGAKAAAERLDVLTRDRSAKVSRDAVIAAKPTIDRIAADLGRNAGGADDKGGLGFRGELHVQGNYDATIRSLANVTYRAGLAPGGDAAVSSVAGAIAKHVDPNRVGRLDEALGDSVRKTGAATLALSVADHLQQDIRRSGRKADQADDILQNVKDGVAGLKKDNQKAAQELSRNKVQTFITELSTLSLSPEKREAALQRYLDNHPGEAREYREKKDAVDRQGAAALRAVDSLRDVPAELGGLGNTKGLRDATRQLENDNVTAFVIATSKGAAKQLERIVQAEGVGKGSLAEAAASSGSSAFEAIGSAFVNNTVSQASKLAAAGKIEEATRTLDLLKDKGSLLGVKDEDLNRALGALQDTVLKSRFARTESELLANQEALKKQLDGVTEFDAGKPAGKLLRLTGVFLSGYGFATNAGIRGDFKPGDTLAALADASGLGKDVTELFKAKADFVNDGKWKAFGRSVGVLGIAVSALELKKQIANGDVASAALTALGIVGGVLALTSVGGPIGLGLGALAVAGQFGLNYFRERGREKGLQEAGEEYLRYLGFNKDVAHRLRDFDRSGHSALPVLAKLAESYGYDLDNPDDVNRFVGYLNSFTGERNKVLDQIVEVALGVDRDKSGDPKTELTDGEKSPPIAGVPVQVQSVEGLRRWLEQTYPGFAPPDLNPVTEKPIG